MDSIGAIDTAQIIKPGLERITALLAALGDPQAGLRCVHVVGTNGKGSTCAYLEAVLRAAGCKVGRFSSPALESARDAITVDGQPMDGAAWEDLAESVGRAARMVEERTGDAPSPFERECAMAFERFRRAGCDICVVEAGLGGRMDATSVIHPDVCAITRIGLDHMEHLGDTLASIAAEKAGAVKAGSLAVSWPQDLEAMRVVEGACRARGCPIAVADFSQLRMQPPDMGRAVRRFAYKGQAYETRMLGAYQPQNASVAIEAALALRRCGWDIPDGAIRQGVADARCPARFEVLGSSPLAIVDGAHNPQGAQALAGSIEEVLRASGKRGMRACFAMGVLVDKDYEAMIAALMPLASAFVAYEPGSPRALPAADLAAALTRQAPADVAVLSAPSAEKAAALALDRAGSGGCMVACGSLYSAAAIRRAILSA